MEWAQRLRVYIEAVEQEMPDPLARPVRHIDEHELYRYFLVRMRELEADAQVARVEALFEVWPQQLPDFARFLERQPRQLLPTMRAEALASACLALDEAIECASPFNSAVARLESKRLVEAFLQHREHASYALENRLVRDDRGERRRLTELGRIFLRLRGKDAVRWLLTLEVVQSSGTADPWRASHALLESVMAQALTSYREGERRPTHNPQTLHRLAELGILEDLTSEDPEVGEYRVVAAIRDVVQAVLEAGPWHTAVRALLEDERAVIVPSSASSATEATVEQTKLIAHEVRNALIPVRHDLGALRALALEPSQRRRVEDARDGVVRVLDFVEDMVQTSELITEPVSRCELSGVIDEALGWIDTSHRVERLRPEGALHVLAPRQRLTRAISNVVGNALQSTTTDQPVRMAVAGGAGYVRITIDDGGPGVPIEHRRRVFLEGVTMRKDGAGSGFGLAFARRVVEEALQGRIWCEDSDLGGARFVIEIPEPSE